MKTTTSVVGWLLLLGVGCSDPEPLNVTEEGRLEESDPRVQQDNSPYDEFTFEAAEGWTIVANLRSTEFDTYLWLLGPDANSLVQDDDSGDGASWGDSNGPRPSNARVTFTTTVEGTYTLRANSFDGQGRGAYTLAYTAGPAAATPTPAAPAPAPAAAE